MKDVGLSAPHLERIADCVVQVGEPLDVGSSALGQRRLIPILSGELRGPLLNARVLPGGADFQLVQSATQMTIQARYVVETDRGERVYIENTGLRVAAPEVIAELNAGRVVDPALVYFRTTPRFETASPALSWLMSALFIGTGARYPDRVILSFFRLA